LVLFYLYTCDADVRRRSCCVLKIEEYAKTLSDESQTILSPRVLKRRMVVNRIRETIARRYCLSDIRKGI